MLEIASQSDAGAARASLGLQLAIDAFVNGKNHAVSLLEASYADEASAVVEVAATELFGEGQYSLPTLEPVFSARLARLTAAAGRGDDASGSLAALLALERASLAENEGRLGAAAAAYALVLELRADSLEALEGLRRLAQLAGARSNEALLLERIGDSLTSITASAAHYAEAALLAEADEQSEYAICLFYKVLSRAPNDDEAFERLLTLLRASEDWPRIENLLGFKLTRLGHKGDRCVPLWLERANIRLFRLQDSQGACSDWQRALSVDPHLFEPLWRLGQSCVDKGASWAARSRFAEATQCDSDNDLSRLTCFIDLAEVCERQQDVVSARNAIERGSSLLGTLTADLWSRLLPLCTRLDLVSVAEQALRSLADRCMGNERAQFLVAAARILRDDEKIDTSVALFLEAIAADPHGDAIFELGSMPASVLRTTQIQSGVASALPILLDEVNGVAMFDVRAVELLEAYARVANQTWRQNVASQLLFLLGNGSARGSASLVVGQLDSNALFAIGRSFPSNIDKDSSLPSNVGALQAAWPTLANAAVKAWAALAGTPVGQRAGRIDLKKETRLDWLLSAAGVLGLDDLSVFSVNVEAGSVALGSPSGAMGISPSIVGGDAASRFRAGRSLALLKMGLPFHSALNVSRDTTMSLVCAAIAGASPQGELAAAGDTDLGLQVAKFLPKKALKTHSSLLEDLATTKLADVRAWLDQCERAADRFGFLLAGDIAESSFALAGTRKLDVVRSAPTVRSLVAFALSSDHFELLRSTGLREPEERDDRE
jgi:tetratricopeptide (TPR) repeat protein